MDLGLQNAFSQSRIINLSFRAESYGNDEGFSVLQFEVQQQKV